MFGGLVALSNFALEVNQWVILGIIGPDGPGKTTIFNMIGWFLLPPAGDIEFKHNTSFLSDQTR